MHVLFSETSGLIQDFHGRTIDRFSYMLFHRDKGTLEHVVGKKGVYPLASLVYRHPTLLLRHLEDTISSLDVDAFAPLIGMRTVTKSGKKLGSVIDFSFDSETFDLINIHTIHRWIWFYYGRRIIPKNRILLVKPREIIVKEDALLLEGKVKKQLMEVSPA